VLAVLALGALEGIEVPVLAGPSSGAEKIKVGVDVLDFEPLADSGQPLTVAQGWNDPSGLQDQYLDDVATASGGIVTQRLVEVSVIRDYPAKPGGFRFTNASYQGCLLDHSPGYCGALIDYGSVLNAVFAPHGRSACQSLRTGRVDEVWLWGGPWFGYLEWLWVAPGTLCPQVRKPFVVMGFSYERGEPEMLHDLGHRAEGLVQSGIGFTLWDRFDGQRSRYGQDFACPAQPDSNHPEVDPASAHAGNVHFPPNAFCHYQYDRDLAVMSDADDWANFPNLTGRRALINSGTWGGTQRGFMIWWLGRFPRHAGSTQGVENDWWRYVYMAKKGHDRVGASDVGSV
jgi:hypothetical protein